MRIVWSDYSDGTPCRVHFYGDDKNCKEQLWMDIKFQAKPIREVGRNGMCMLDIIDAIIKRLDDFQAKWPCSENEMAVRSLYEAKEHLKEKRERRLKEAKKK